MKTNAAPTTQDGEIGRSVQKVKVVKENCSMALIDILWMLKTTMENFECEL